MTKSPCVAKLKICFPKCFLIRAEIIDNQASRVSCPRYDKADPEATRFGVSFFSLLQRRFIVPQRPTTKVCFGAIYNPHWYKEKK
jgi:hypothetical protein